ncbi:polysaccharide biosynthesis protein [Bacillus sp. FJAT-49736]|uniref:putative polysaccharide biosynthesis protein n=1 Tax=Bacillus sp. FJAT-49736 TaxID=2833582 RepID=UPI001BCA53EA|nr:polysaccharide biosynthesis protein [Bacillus sp. FJAT-49736]MBS4175766.1 polysaccharide biosynthesis protein [Bacillus sp. FJAT-49736]
MTHEDSKKIVKGAFILTIAAAITKILSAVYRVPFQNIVGDVGFYIYQQIYPIYGIAIALATYGFPVIISKLVAEGEAGNDINIRQMMKSIFILLSMLGIFLFLIVFIGSPFIAKLMGDQRLEPLIKTISFSFLLVPFVSIIRGYFQGKGMMLPTGISQVTEQFIRVASILILTFFLVRKGYSLYITGEGALIGSIAGGVVSLFVLISFFWRFRRKGNPTAMGGTRVKLGKTFLLHGMAICISGMLLVLFQLVDSLNIYALLTKSGVSLDEAKKLKGIYDRGQPLLQLGTIVATSLSLTLVPVISSAFKMGNDAILKEKVLGAMKISIIVGMGATVGLINIMEPTNMMLFKNDQGSIVLAVFSISILFSSIILTITGILQGIGRVYTPALYMIIGVLIKFIANQWFVPIFGTLGAAIATVIALGIVSVCCIARLSAINLGKLSFQYYIKVIAAAFIMTAVLQGWIIFWKNIIPLHRSSSIFFALSGVIVGGIAYLLSILGLKLFKGHEIEMIPFGNKLFKRHQN